MKEQKPSKKISKEDHFLKKEMIKMDINSVKKRHKPRHEVKFIRLTLDDEMYLAPGQPSKKHQTFLDIARKQMLNMDKKSNDFLQNAAKKMVKDVLGQEFGKNFMDDKGFAHMQETIANKLLHNKEYKKILQKLLGLIDNIQSDDSP